MYVIRGLVLHVVLQLLWVSVFSSIKLPAHTLSDTGLHLPRKNNDSSD